MDRRIVWLVGAVGCLLVFFVGRVEAVWIEGQVTDGRNPIAGARVRLHGSTDYQLTDQKGHFRLEVMIQPNEPIIITAGKEGWFNRGIYVTGSTSFTTIVLDPISQVDEPDYLFRPPHYDFTDLRINRFDPGWRPGFVKNACGFCHYQPGCGFCHKDFLDQWQQSMHAQATTDPWVLDLYNGTDRAGKQGIGPGWKLDYPDKAGDCADCHAPSAAIKAPGQTDLYQVVLSGDVGANGVHCDFCHKVQDVKVSNGTGLQGAMTLHRQSLIKEGEEYNQRGLIAPIEVFGALDDVIPSSPTPGSQMPSPMQASYAPIFRESAFCSACHQFENEQGVPVQWTYAEWQESPYRESKSQCQDCHMKPDGLARLLVWGDADKFWSPRFDRDPSTIFSHRFAGTTEDLLKTTATLEVDIQPQQETLTVRVGVTNVHGGHKIPTGVNIRNMILLVSATTEGGDSLFYLGQQRIPAYGGVGPVEQGNYAGLPGKGFALVLADAEGNLNVMDWQATRVVSDNRIKARATDRSRYVFARPPEVTRATVETRLIYRKAFKPLADVKGWDLKEVVMAAETVVVEWPRGPWAVGR